MQTSTPKISHLIMTGLGLAMFVLALTLDHYHPHNQGIAEITHSLYHRIGISQSSDSASFNLSYVAPLPAAHPKPTAKKLNDPTTSSASAADQSLPTVTLANGQIDPGTTDANKQTSSNDFDSAGSQSNQGQPHNAPKPDTDN